MEAAVRRNAKPTPMTMQTMKASRISLFLRLVRNPAVNDWIATEKPFEKETRTKKQHAANANCSDCWCTEEAGDVGVCPVGKQGGAAREEKR